MMAHESKIRSSSHSEEPSESEMSLGEERANPLAFSPSSERESVYQTRWKKMCMCYEQMSKFRGRKIQ